MGVCAPGGARGGDRLSGDVGECGHAQVDGGTAVSGDLVHLVELVFGGGAAEGEAVHVPAPAVGGGLGDPGRQVVADLHQPGGVRPGLGAAAGSRCLLL
jgi:hypothetical protein